MVNKEIIYSYIAGLIDGEGNLGIKMTTHRNNPKQKNTFDVFIRCSMTDKEPIQLLKDEFGGSMFIEIRKNDRHKDIWRWQVSGNKAVPLIIKKILPYLIVKKKQGDLIMDFVLKRKCQMGKGRSGGTEENEYDWRFKMYEKSKVLNNRKNGK